MMNTIVLKKHEERRILSGHQWVFSNEIGKIEGSPAVGDVVGVVRHDRRFLGSGFYHPHSLIAVRLLSTEAVEPDEAFFRTRIERALAQRRLTAIGAEAFRLVHGEADFLPGLIIDKYGDSIVVQAQSAGMDMRLDMICNVLETVLHPVSIVARNDSSLRALEHLSEEARVLRGSVDRMRIVEHGLAFNVDLLHGQKTGLFLDQRNNRKSVRQYLAGRSVIDCFCNDGGFAMNASAAGAKSVLAVDISADAIARATENAASNASPGISFQTADVFDLLRELADAGKRFDAIILDPPSFTKSKKTVATALHGYKAINTLAMRLLSPDGILATASCSHHIDRNAFMEMLQTCAGKSRRDIQLLEFHGAAPDHPVLPSMPETSYLKFAILSVR